jgi:hypothetical protein
MSTINDVLTKLDEMRDSCEEIYVEIDAGLAEGRDVGTLIAEFGTRISRYEGLQASALGELRNMENELKGWGERADD